MSILPANLRELLRITEFVHVATIDNGRPYVAPKFLINVENDFLYLADFVLGNTWEDLRRDPRLSLSVLDYDTLEGFQLNGTACLLEHGTEYARLADELNRREISLSADRVLASLGANKKSKVFEIASRRKLGIIRVEVADILKISWSGTLERKKGE